MELWKVRIDQYLGFLSDQAAAAEKQQLIMMMMMMMIMITQAFWTRFYWNKLLKDVLWLAIQMLLAIGKFAMANFEPRMKMFSKHYI